MQLTDRVVSAFAPTGALRASINLGNPILARLDELGKPSGISVDIAKALASRLGVPLEFVVFDAAGKSVEAVSADQADIGFFAIDPIRGKGISFTAPYLLIEGAYLVKADSSVSRLEEVDQLGNTVMVGKGSAYDLFLTRELKQATIERAPTSPAVVEHFLSQGASVAAGVKQQLEADADRIPGLRLLPGNFMVIQQALGLPNLRCKDAAEYLSTFVETIKADGLIADLITQHKVAGVSIAPPAREVRVARS